MRPIWRRIAIIVALLGATLIGVAVLVPPTQYWVFDPSSVAPEVGRAYQVAVPRKDGLWFRLETDRSDAPSASRLELREDGILLGPAHSQHDTIRAAAGAGAFSHWGDYLIFATSDGSDPRTNGRRYVAESPLTLRGQWTALALLLVVLAVLVSRPIILARLRTARQSIQRVQSVEGRNGRLVETLLGWASLIAAGALFFVIVVWLLAPVTVLPLDPALGKREGAAIVMPLSVSPTRLYRLVSDDYYWPRRSRLLVHEDDRLLGPTHSVHESVRDHGRGAYSHWEGHLFWSTSDNSDPLSNGRRYWIEAPFSLRVPWILIGWGAGIIAVVAGLALLHLQGRSGPLLALARRIGEAAVEVGRSRRREHPTVAFLLLAFGVVLSVGLVVAGWFFGDATGSGAEIARFLPVSDAVGYHSCATSIVAFGQLDQAFGSVWCSRRILYTTMLATLLMMSGSDSAIALVLQGTLAGLAAAAFVVRIARYIGIVGAAMVALVLLAYMWEFVFGLFLTEVAGFSLSLFALVLLLSFAETRRPVALFAGCALFSVAMASRAGAMFALPAVAFWALVAVTPSSGTGRWRLLAISVAGLSVGAVLQFGVVLMIGSDPSNTGGNFAASLYGLSIGSRNWADAYRDFGPLFQKGEQAAFEHIYGVALQTILDRPGVFLSALGAAELEYLRGLFRFGFLESANPVLSALAGLGVIGCILQFHSPLARLLLALAVGEIVSAPLIFDSGGVRVFASTVFLRAAFCGAGLQLLLLRLARGRSFIDWQMQRATRTVTGSLASGTGAAIVLAMVISATPFNRLTHRGLVGGLGCPDGLIEVVARIGDESQLLSFTSRATMLESVEPFRIGRQRFAGDERMRGSAFGGEILSIERPLTILRAVDLSLDAKGRRIKALAYRGELEPSDVPRSLCVDPAQSILFANYSHHLIRTVRERPALR